LTGIASWREADGPKVGCDYWYEATDEDGDVHEAHIFVDQCAIVVSVDGETIFETSEAFDDAGLFVEEYP
jgi:hypothetical protein